MKNSEYNSVVVFERGISFKDDKGNPIKIWGLLFKKEKSNPNDLLMWCLNRYISYLLSAEGVESRGGEIEQEMWTCDKGKMTLVMTNNMKNFIYRALKKDIISYRIIEYDKAVEILDGENVDSFIVSTNPLIRLGLVDGKEEKLDGKKIARQHILLQKLQTLSQYNQMDDDDNEDVIEVASNQGQKPSELSLSLTEKEKRALKGMLLLEGLDNNLDYKEDVSYVKSYDDYIKENYPTEIAKNYDNSQICYDNRMEKDDLEEEE